MGSFDEGEEGPPLTQTRTSHAVIEALDGVCMPDVRDRILLEALREAGMRELPTPEQLEEFVGGALRNAVTATLGEQTADAVAESLDPIIKRAMARRSSVKKKDLARAAATPPPPEPHGQTFVLVATKDHEAAGDVQKHLESLAVVHAVRDVWALVRAAEVYSTSKPRLVVDCRPEEVTSEQLESLARMAPPNARVVLWGLGDELEAVTQSAQWQKIDWTGTDAECDARDLAMLCTGGRVSSVPPDRRTLRPAQRGPTEQMGGNRPTSGAQRRLSKHTIARMHDQADGPGGTGTPSQGTQRSSRPSTGTPSKPASRPAATPRPGGSGVLVTSDPAVQVVLEQALSSVGLEHHAVGDAGSALAHLAGATEPPKLVVATLEEREMTPLRFAHAARAVHEQPPHVVVLLRDNETLNGDLSGISCVAPRTVSATALAEALRALLG